MGQLSPCNGKKKMIVMDCYGCACYDSTDDGKHGPMGWDYSKWYYCTLSGWSVVSFCLLIFWLGTLLYTLCHTADNYFSPCLAEFCDKLNMSPDVAGVTVLALGNGAPDVFSSTAALSGGSGQANVLVGVGGLLGGCAFITTVVVGGILRYSSSSSSSSSSKTSVPPLAFCRDLTFFLVGVGLVLFYAGQRQITLWAALSFLFLYALYVYFVVLVDRHSRRRGFGGQGGGGDSDTHRRQEETPGADLLGGAAGGRRSSFWHIVSAAGAPTAGAAGGGAAATEDIIEADPPAGRSGGEVALSPIPSDGGGRERGAEERSEGASGGLNNMSSSTGIIGAFDPHQDVASGEEAPIFDHAMMRANYFAKHGHGGAGKGGSGEESARSQGGEGVPSDIVSMLPASVVSHFSDAQGMVPDGQEERGELKSPLVSEGAGGDLEQPLLGVERPLLGAGGLRLASLQQQHGVGQGQQGVRHGARGPCVAASAPGSSLGGKKVWVSVYWRQWRMRRRLHRRIVDSDVWGKSVGVRFLYLLELPVVVLRNLTIPSSESEGWSHEMVSISMGLAPLFVAWVVGLTSPQLWAVLLFGSLALGLAVSVGTRPSRPPSNLYFALSITAVSFLSCIAWIYLIAGEVVAVLETIGSITGFPTSVLGLTVLAWGNSCGDLVTNLAVSKAGYPGMAIAGCYGGPLFNLLLGLGLPLTLAAIRQAPTPLDFSLDGPSILSIVYILTNLSLTLGTMIWQGFAFPRWAPMALGVGYSVYVVLMFLLLLS